MQAVAFRTILVRYFAVWHWTAWQITSR